MDKTTSAVMTAPGEAISVRELKVPPLEPDSAYLKVTYSEVCGTDVHLQDGKLSGVPYPIIPGHVSVGVVSEIRGTIRDVQGGTIREGDEATFLDVHGSCGHCWYCLVAKATTRCPNRRVYGITFGVDDGLAGGWSRYIYLRPGTRILPLRTISPQRFMAGGCSLPTALHAVDRAEIRLGDSVLVLGSGPVGLSLIALARLSGAGRVLCIGAPTARLENATAMGADATLDFSTCDEDVRRDWVRNQTDGRGADITIEASGAPVAVAQALRWTRDAGRVVIVGQYTDAGDTPINPHLEINRKHLEIRGVWGCDFSHVQRSLDVLRLTEKDCPWDRVQCDTYGLEQTNEALAAVRSARVVKALIDPWK